MGYYLLVYLYNSYIDTYSLLGFFNMLNPIYGYDL